MGRGSRVGHLVLGLALSASMLPATSADDINYDWWGAQRNDMLSNWVYQARGCMRQGVEYQLQLGVRDSEKILDWIMKPCGGHLTKVLQQWYGKSLPEATDLVRALAKEELVRVVGPVSPRPPASTRK
jgi:hypothetical protein